MMHYQQYTDMRSITVIQYKAAHREGALMNKNKCETYLRTVRCRYAID